MFLKKIIKATLKFSLPIGFAFVIMMMATTSFFSLLDIQNTAKTIVKPSETQNYYNELLKTMYSSVYEKSLIIADMINTDDAFKNDELFLRLNELTTEYTVARARFESQDLDPKLQTILDRQGQLTSNNIPQILNVYEAIQNDHLDKAKKLFTDITLPSQKMNLQLINQMVDLQFSLEQNRMAIADKRLIQNRTTIVFVNISIVLLSILISIFLLYKQHNDNRKLRTKATMDVLTGLPNRERLIKSMDEYIKQQPTHTFAVLFFDIDFFKNINDNYGHSVGDLVIQKFANRIISQTYKNDILSRFGGDEFVLFLRSIKTEEQAEKFVEILSSSLNTSFKIKNDEIFITASIGVSLYNKSGNNSGDGIASKSLLKQADIAMYTAKESGRNCFRFFSKKDSDKIANDYAISHALHTLLKDEKAIKELSLVYQPLVNIHNPDIAECEALIRWKTRDGKRISPDDFIPLAEKSNLIEKINHFVVETVCKQQSNWCKQGLCDIRININLSGNRLVFNSTLKHLETCMDQYFLYPRHFGIELTERTLFEISDETIKQLDFLRRQGMKISIDDFGTEYSSLSYLKKLPITTLKIDKSFIAGLANDKDDQALVKSIIGMGHSLQLNVVAEGVETSEQLDILTALSCTSIQGYYFHRPLAPSQVATLQLAS